MLVLFSCSTTYIGEQRWKTFDINGERWAISWHHATYQEKENCKYLIQKIGTRWAIGGSISNENTERLCIYPETRVIKVDYQAKPESETTAWGEMICDKSQAWEKRRSSYNSCNSSFSYRDSSAEGRELLASLIFSGGLWHLSGAAADFYGTLFNWGSVRDAVVSSRVLDQIQDKKSIRKSSTKSEPSKSPNVVPSTCGPSCTSDQRADYEERYQTCKDLGFGSSDKLFSKCMESLK